MSDSFSDERADMATNTHLVIVSDGDTVHLNRNDMYIQVKSGSAATSITTSPPSAVPIGLRMTLDNSNGSGTLNVNSSTVQVPAGLVYEAKVAGDGSGSYTLVVAGPSETPNTLTTLGALQSAIDNDLSNGRTLNLQAGETELTSTLTIDGGTGGALYGKGRTEAVDPSSEYPCLGSTLVYTGTKVASEAAIHYRRADFVLQDLSIQGKTSAQVLAGTGTKTPRGIFIDKEAGVGTGKIEARNIRLSGFETAIECAGALADNNCDESAWYSVLINTCTRGFRSNNVQGLSHKFYNLRCGQVDTVFDYIAGGKLAVTDCFLASPCTLLQLRNDQSGGFGTNGSRWVFRGVDLDSAARNTKLLDIESGISYLAHIVFDGGHFSRNSTDVWDNYAWHIGDNMHVTINDFHNIMGGMIKYTTTGATSSITINGGTSLEGEISAVGDLIDPASTGTSPMVIINNLMPNNSNTPLNYSGTV